MYILKLSKSPKYPFVFINGELTPTMIRSLDLETSFTVQNVDFVLKAREKAGDTTPWDGKIRFLYKSKNGNYYFPVGLLDRVLKVLKWYDITPEIDLKFDESEFEFSYGWSGPELRSYQIDAFIQAKSYERCIVNLPTGAGKTLLGIKLLSKIGKPTLIIVHRKELLHQWRDAIKAYTGQDATIFTDKKKEKVFGEVTIAMVTSLHNWLKKKENKLPSFDVLILDEAHHTPADTFYRVALKCDARYRFGLTATTQREDGADLYMTAAIGEIKSVVSAEELISSFALAKPRFEFIDLPPTFGRLGGDFASVYKNGIVLNGERNKAIVSRAMQLAAEDRQVYIHVEHIAHGKLLSEMSGYPFCYSATKDRDDIIRSFRDGKTKVLISTLLGEGVDIPNIGAIIMAGGRKTKIGTIQKVGRALRPGKDKDAIVVDFIDKGKYLSLHTRERFNAYVEFYGDYVVNSNKE